MSRYKITPLHLGDITRPKSNMIYGYTGTETGDFPLIAYYLEGEHRILVDTGGNPPDSAQGRKAAPYKRAPEQELPAALAQLGVRPEEIEYVILTHLHWDHAANSHLFPNAELFCQRAEWEGLDIPANAAKGYELDYIRGLACTLIDGDRELFDGVSVILAPGHTPGMQCVLVDTDMGRALLTGDLVTLRESLACDPPAFNALLYDPPAAGLAQASLDKILGLSRLVLPGHDPGVFAPGLGLRRHILQWAPDVSLCAGCGACEIVCALTHEGVSGSRSRRIFFEHDSVQLMHEVYACQQCAQRPCYDACPKRGEAMKLDPDTGVVYVEPDGCVGCGLCVAACPYTPKRIQLNRAGRAIKCDLCRGRENGPACIEYCQCLAIGMSTDMPPVPGVVVNG